MSAKPLAQAYRYDAERNGAAEPDGHAQGAQGQGSGQDEETARKEMEEVVEAFGQGRSGEPSWMILGGMTEEEWAEHYSRLVPIYEAVPPPPGVDPASDWYLQLTDRDLPCQDGIPMETWQHARQLQLLTDVLRPEVDGRGEGFVGDNMFLYYCREQVEGKYVRGPDMFVSLGVEPFTPDGPRRSYVVWQEGKPPDVIIELLSLSTAEKDKTEKKEAYQNDVKVAEYYWIDPFRPDDFAGFVLESGVYRPMERDDKGRYVSQALGLALTRWEGEYAGEHAIWLRWARLSGEILPTPQEQAAAEAKARAESDERAAAEAKRAAAEAKRAAAEAKRAAAEAKARAREEQKRLKAEEKAQAEAKRAAEADKRAAAEAKARAREEQKRLKAEEKAQAEAKRAAEADKRAAKADKRAAAEAKARAELERQLAELQEKLAAVEPTRPKQRVPRS